MFRRLFSRLLLSLALLQPAFAPAQAQMLQAIVNASSTAAPPPAALTRVGTATSTTTTVTCPTHAIGDILAIFAYRTTTTAPTLPAGWVSPATPTKTGTTFSGRIGLRVATSTTDASGTWTNATGLVCMAYRPASGYTAIFGAVAWNSSTTVTVNYPALTMGDPNSGFSWVIGFAAVSNLTQTIGTAPTGLTNQVTLTGSATQAAGFDTTAGVTSWTSANATNTGTAGDSVSATLEIMMQPTTNNLSSYVYQYQAFEGLISRGITANSITLPMPNTSGTGNAFVLVLTNDGGATVTSIADNINGTWGAATTTALPGAGSLDSRVYVEPNIASGMTTVTVTFSAAVTYWRAQLYEFYGVAASPANGSHSVAQSTTIGAGSYTPGANAGGNLVFASFIKSSQGPTNTTTHVTPGVNFQLLAGDIAWAQGPNSFTEVTEGYVQVTPAAINPAFISIGETGDTWNSLSVALKVSPGSGTAPNSSSINVANIQHFSTLSFPAGATANYSLQVSFSGNLRVITCTDGNLNALTVHDSDGNAYTALASVGMWYAVNTKPNSNALVFISGGGSDPGLSWRAFDIANATASPFQGSAVPTNTTLSGMAAWTPSPAPSPANSSGLVIETTALGQGPGLSVTLPSGATWFLDLYTGETDIDTTENADIGAIYYYTASGAQIWANTITTQVSNSANGGFAWFH